MSPSERNAQILGARPQARDAKRCLVNAMLTVAQGQAMQCHPVSAVLEFLGARPQARDAKRWLVNAMLTMAQGQAAQCYPLGAMLRL